MVALVTLADKPTSSISSLRCLAVQLLCPPKTSWEAAAAAAAMEEEVQVPCGLVVVLVVMAVAWEGLV